MAENTRTPEDSSSESPQSTEPAAASEENRPKRVRRRAGAPAGAPTSSAGTPASAPPADAQSSPRTSVPTQSVEDEEAPRQASPQRRRAGAPAGPPSAPQFTPPQPIRATAGAEDDAADDDAATAQSPATTTVGASGAPGAGGIADDLAALASTRTSDDDAGDEETREKREQDQQDFASLLFQAPAPRRARRSAGRPEVEDTAEEDTSGESSDEGEETEDEDAARDGSTEEKSEGSRRRRRRGGRGRRGRGRGDSDDSGAASDQDDQGDQDDSSAGDDSEEEDTADGGRGRGGRRRSRRRGGGENGSDTEDDSTEDSEEQDDTEDGGGRRSGRGGRSRRSRKRGSSEDSAGDSTEGDANDDDAEDDSDGDGDSRSSSRRRRRRRRSGSGSGGEDRPSPDDPPNTVVKVREARDEVKAVKGSTRLEAKKQRRREGRDAGRRRNVITEAEFLARRESVKRSMVVREKPGRTQIAVLEDDVLVEHYVAQKTQTSMVGNVYLGKVQNVLPSMEAAFVDIGRGRNAVLYAGEVNWDAAGLDGQPRRIELALKSGDTVLVQVTKDPIGHKGARLTSQISLPGRYLVFVPGGSMTGISRKLPDAERARLKKIMKQAIPDEAGVIVRTAAEGASEEELTRDVERLRKQWAKIEKSQKSKNAPVALSQEPDLAIRVVRDVFNEDFTSLIVEGEKTYEEIHDYVSSVAPDLLERLTRHLGEKDAFAKHRIDEQLLKAMDRKVYLPSGGSLVIDRTEAMTVVDVNTGKFTGSGGSLEETVTKNNLEAAEEVVRQLRLRDIGGIIVIDFIDMVLEDNRELVLRRLVECLGRDRTKHQVAEVTSLGLVQMTRKRVGQGLVDTFSSTCEACNGRGIHVDIDGHHQQEQQDSEDGRGSRRRSGRGRKGNGANGGGDGGQASSGSADSSRDAGENGGHGNGEVHRLEEDQTSRELARATIASIAAATSGASHPEVTVDGQLISVDTPEAEQQSDPDSTSDA